MQFTAKAVQLQAMLMPKVILQLATAMQLPAKLLPKVILQLAAMAMQLPTQLLPKVILLLSTVRASSKDHGVCSLSHGWLSN